MAEKAVLTERVVTVAETRQRDSGGWHVVDEGVGDRVLLLHGQEHDMRNPHRH
jgi:hypothetical protein